MRLNLAGVHDVLEEDRLITQIREVTKRCKAEKKRAFEEHKTMLVKEIDFVWLQRDAATSWALARRMSFKMIWPQCRTYRCAIVSKPCVQQWQEYLQLPGKSGGMLASSVDYSSVLADLGGYISGAAYALLICFGERAF